jgi:hypothetical protein
VLPPELLAEGGVLPAPAFPPEVSAGCVVPTAGLVPVVPVFELVAPVGVPFPLVPIPLDGPF